VMSGGYFLVSASVTMMSAIERTLGPERPPAERDARARAAPDGAGSYDRRSHHVVPGGEALRRIVPGDR